MTSAHFHSKGTTPNFKDMLTRNTTPAKPREVRFCYIWFVCDLTFQGWCFKSGPKSNTHCVSYIVHELTADHILTSWKMAASSVLTVNYRGEALFVNVFVPNKESCLRQIGKFIFMCEKNCEYLLSVFFKRKKCQKIFVLP